MEPEGVVDALRRAHELVAPGGLLLDLRPSARHPRIRGGGHDLGAVDQSGFFPVLARTDAAVDEAVAAGLFRPLRSLAAAVRTTFDSAGELLEVVGGWQGTVVPDDLAARLRDAEAPYEAVEAVDASLLERPPV